MFIRISFFIFFFLYSFQVWGGESYLPSGVDSKGVGIIQDEDDKGCGFCDFPELFTFYKNDENRFIQSFKMIGVYQWQRYFVDADDQGSHNGWENRYWRGGVKGKLFNFLDVFLNFNLNTSKDFSGRFVDTLDKGGLKLNLSKNLVLSVGKIQPDIIHEYYTSVKRLNTIHRSMIVHKVAPSKVGGGELSYNYGDFTYKFAGFLGGLDDDYKLPNLDGGYGLFNSLAYDLNDFSKFRLDYFYNDGDLGNNGFKDYDHIFSFVSEHNFGRYGFMTDFIYADGMDDINDDDFSDSVSDVYGFVLLSYYDIIEKRLRFVMRYHYVKSTSDNGLELPKRYESRVDNLEVGRGDVFHSIYAGLNLYLCGENLKIINGVKYSRLEGRGDDFDSLSFTAGVRLFF